MALPGLVFLLPNILCMVSKPAAACVSEAALGLGLTRELVLQIANCAEASFKESAPDLVLSAVAIYGGGS